MPEAKLPLRHLIQSPPSQARPLRAPLGHRTFLCEKAGLPLGLSPPSCHRKGQCHSFLVNTPKSPPSPAGNFPNSGSTARPQSQGLPNLSPRLNLLQPAPPHPPSFTRSLPIPSPACSPSSDLAQVPSRPALRLSAFHSSRETRPGPHRGRHVLRRPPQPGRGAAKPTGRGEPRTASAHTAAP